MATPRDHEAQPRTAGASGRQGVSRRNVMAATVGGLGLAAVPGNAYAARHRIGVGSPGTTPVEFRGRINQSGPSGQQFTAYGYLTRVAGTKQSDLFDGAVLTDSTALLTVSASGDLEARVLDVSVHSLDIVGTMSIHQREHGGADFDDPSSFRVGPVVARFDLRLQDVLAVYAVGRGIPTLTGDMVQTTVGALSGPLAGKVFGKQHTRTHLFATGLGTLRDPVTLNALLEIAGNWLVE